MPTPPPTPITALDLLRSHLLPIVDASVLTGTVCLMSRVAHSVTEDVVLNALPMAPAQITLGRLNVNGYCKDISVSVGGQKSQRPNTDRLRIMAEVLTSALPDTILPNSGGRWAFWIGLVSLIAQPETGEHYVNVRLDYRFYP